jgi:hydrogenase maturation protein HypF
MERRSIEIRGIVQGVGFRPFVYHLAVGCRLTGFVRNEFGRVRAEVQGDSQTLDRFIAQLREQAPQLARIESLTWTVTPLREATDFRIEASSGERAAAASIAPDAATCQDCLAELFDPSNRRYHYPFINCTNCGPRLTIVTGAPYDRSRTTMASFPMCDACRAEYEDPADRRFHAQPIACPACGPRLTLLDAGHEPIPSEYPIRDIAQALREGRICAVKGLGGFHLACDAANAEAVAELRRRKHRIEKPFAVMVRNRAHASELCDVGPEESRLLESCAAPIVLLRRKPEGGLAPDVAPGCPFLGVMLPYTPIHHLLMHELDGLPLVMTSGNRFDEPIVHRNDDLGNLATIVDLYLTHDRPIHVRCDDTVTRVMAGRESPIRRSRGAAPRPIPLPIRCPVPILAVGGQLKATFALAQDNQVYLSHHLGDLDHLEASRACRDDIALYEQLFDIRPQVVVHDLHPDYSSTSYALERSSNTGIRVRGVQHHHAHMASCMAENGVAEPVIGVCFDGTGFGLDGTIWGGEFLVGDYRGFRRAGHLRSVAMPGGEMAVRQPWRMSLAHLVDAGCLEDARLPVPIAEVRIVCSMLEKRFQAPLTSSIGRLFDAVAGLLGLRLSVSYEGQAAAELEWLASVEDCSGHYPFEIEAGSARILDMRPLIRAVVADIANGVSQARIARRFHDTIVEMVAAMCRLLREETGLRAVVLSGGVFLNALLTQLVDDRLSREDFVVYQHHLAPTNDGGLALGQVAVAAAMV